MHPQLQRRVPRRPTFEMHITLSFEIRTLPEEKEPKGRKLAVASSTALVQLFQDCFSFSLLIFPHLGTLLVDFIHI